MKTLIKWFVKHYVSKDTLKAAIHAANESLAKVEVDEAKTKVIGVANDVSDLVGVYLTGYADNGRIDPDELEQVNSKCDAAVDKYVSDATVEAFIDKIFA